MRSRVGERSWFVSSAANSKPSVRPPSMVHGASIPWQVNGTAPVANSSRKRRMHGSPASPSRRSQTRMSAPRSSRRSKIIPSAHVGTCTANGRPVALATTAAASAALPHDEMASVVSVGTSSTARWRARPNRWRALWLPDTLPVSSLAQMPPLWPMASARAVWFTRGVVRKPWPSTSATASSRRRTTSTNRASVHPAARARWCDQSSVRKATNGLESPPRRAPGPGQVAPGGAPSQPGGRPGLEALVGVVTRPASAG